MQYVKLFVRYAVVLPIALLWTAWFWIVEKIYLGSKYINEKGEEVIEKVVNKLE